MPRLDSGGYDSHHPWPQAEITANEERKSRQTAQRLALRLLTKLVGRVTDGVIHEALRTWLRCVQQARFGAEATHIERSERKTAAAALQKQRETAYRLALRLLGGVLLKFHSLYAHQAVSTWHRQWRFKPRQPDHLGLLLAVRGGQEAAKQLDDRVGKLVGRRLPGSGTTGPGSLTRTPLAAWVAV